MLYSVASPSAFPSRTARTKHSDGKQVLRLARSAFAPSDSTNLSIMVRCGSVGKIQPQPERSITTQR
jgi:hypothetical protein